MPINYYIVLGLPSTSSQADIKAAYRRLAKEYHPDYYGEGHSPFQTIQEAYSVLSDPIRRRAYDNKSRAFNVTGAGRSRDRDTESMTNRREVKAEPLNSDQEPVDLSNPSLAQSFQVFRPSFEALFDRLLCNFTPGNHRKGDRPESLAFVITLTHEQAFRGGHAQIKVPARHRCPSCMVQRNVGFYECWRCSGTGIVAGEFAVMVNYPPGIQNNHAVQLSLERYGFRNFSVNVKFRINCR